MSSTPAGEPDDPAATPLTPAAPLRLILVRHGRTVYNATGLVQGWSDSPLTAEGLAGAQATAEALAGLRFAGAWSSPSGRAVATAREILARHPDVPLDCDDGLREFHFGDYEATPEADVWARITPRDLFRQVLAGTHPGLPGAAEDGAGYLARVAAAFGRIEQAHQAGGDVLVVSHGVTLITFLTMAGIQSPSPLDNATVTVVSVDAAGHRRVEAANLDAAQAAAFLRAPAPGRASL